MEVSSDDLRRYYESLSDEMLREIDPRDLTEVGRRCYQHEVEQRELKQRPAPREPADAPEGPEEEAFEEDLELQPDWMEHAACACSYTAVPGSDVAADAEFARNVLLDAGIPCRLSVLPPEGPNAPPFDEYRVMVPDAVKLKALSVLDKEIFNAELEADWRTHFAALDDDQFRALNPEVICAGLLDRVERLTQAFKDEQERRRSK